MRANQQQCFIKSQKERNSEETLFVHFYCLAHPIRSTSARQTRPRPRQYVMWGKLHSYVRTFMCTIYCTTQHTYIHIQQAISDVIKVKPDDKIPLHTWIRSQSKSELKLLLKIYVYITIYCILSDNQICVIYFNKKCSISVTI